MVDLSNIYGGYLKAGRYSSIKDTDLTKALKPYGLTLKSLRSNRRVSDVSLRQRAVKAVLARRGKLKIAKKGPKNPTGRTSTTTGVKGVNYSGY